jgi:hypothetical protein
MHDRLVGHLTHERAHEFEGLSEPKLPCVVTSRYLIHVQY